MKLLEGYNQTAKAFHWLMAIMIISLIGVGIYMHELPREDEMRPILYSAHKATGMMVMFLFFGRLAWRFMNKPPSLDRYSGVVKKAATFSHTSLYVLMFLVPLAGYLLSSYHGYAVDMYGLFKLPILVEKNKELADVAGEAHEILAFTMLAIIIVHVAGAIKHLLEKD